MRSQLQYSEMKWNDLPKCSLLTTFLFADDTTLFASADSLEELMLFVNSDLHKVVTFLELTKWFCTPQKQNLFYLTAMREKVFNFLLIK